VQIILLLRQIDASSSQAHLVNISLLTIAHQAVIDAYLCLLHLTTGTQPLARNPHLGCADGLSTISDQCAYCSAVVSFMKDSLIQRLFTLCSPLPPRSPHPQEGVVPVREVAVFRHEFGWVTQEC
jgi:hypothetical protein